MATTPSVDVVVVSVGYGLAPQNKHPGLINDCYKGLQWTLKNAKALGGADGKFFTAGTSAGGQLALGLALKAIDEGLGNALVGVVALVPATVHPKGVPEELKPRWTSYKEHAEHTINTASAMECFWGKWGSARERNPTNSVPDAFGGPPTDPYVSPLLHGKLNALKKVYMAVAGQDTLRDDGLLFKEKLEENKYAFLSGIPRNSDTF
jgi:versiconal hemiacetal acetate esterase